MSRALRLFVFVIVGTVTGCAGPTTPAPASVQQSQFAPSAAPDSPGASTPGAWMPYTSERFGYSLEVPAEWRYRAATEDWPADVYPAAGAAYTDNFEQPSENFPTVDIVTRQLGAGETQEAFLAWLDEQNAAICTVEETSEVGIDGTNARLQRQTCGYNAWEVVAFDGDRVYLIYWLGEPSLAESDWPIFEQVLATFRFG